MRGSPWLENPSDVCWNMCGHLSASVRWDDVQAAVYLDRARGFPLAPSGEPQWLTGMANKPFLRRLLGSGDQLDYGQIKWPEPQALMAEIRIPYDQKSTDEPQNEIQYGRSDGKRVPFHAFLLRCAGEGKTHKDVGKLMTCFRTISTQLSQNSSEMQRRCQMPFDTRHAPSATLYSRLPEEMGAHPWPKVIVYPLEAMAKAGVALLRNANRSTGFLV